MFCLLHIKTSSLKFTQSMGHCQKQERGGTASIGIPQNVARKLHQPNARKTQSELKKPSPDHDIFLFIRIMELRITRCKLYNKQTEKARVCTRK